MNAVWGWLFNAPVWIQTPLVVVFLVLLSAALAFVVMKVMSLLMPPSVAEREMLAEQPRANSSGEGDMGAGGSATGAAELHPQDDEATGHDS